MKNWPTKPLGEVLEISRERIEPTEHPDTPFNYVGLESIEGHTGKILPYQPTLGAEIKSTKNVFHRNEILYGKLRPYLNKVHLATEDGICSTDIYVLRPQRQQIHPSFAAYYLRSPAVLAVVSSAMAGANLPRIGQEALLDISVRMPPLADQERFVRLLDEADELQKLRVQADGRTSTLIGALFHEMFGDPARNEHNLDLVKLMDVIAKEKHSIRRGPFGGAIKKEIFVADGFKIYEQKNAIRDNFEIGNYYIDEAKFNELEGFSILPDDLIISCSGTIGKVAIVPKGARPGIINQALLKLRLDVTKALPVFFKHLLETDHMQRLIFGGAAGSAIKNVMPLDQVKKSVFPLPPIPLQNEFVQRVKEIRVLESKQATSRARLDTLFQSMLHRAFN